MEFAIEFYSTATGQCPVREFLEDLRESDQYAHDVLLGKFVALRDSRNHGEPLTKAIGSGLLELRVLGRLNTRVLFFFRKGRRVILVHGIRNKRQKIERRDLDVARARMKEWIERHKDE